MNKKLWRRLCSSYETWSIFVSFNTVLLALLVYAFVFGDIDGAAYVAAILTLAVIIANFAIFGYLWIKCRRFHQRYEQALDQL